MPGVLLIDTDYGRGVIAAILVASGFEIAYEECTSCALERMRSFPAHVVVADAGRLDDFPAFAERLRAGSPSVRILNVAGAGGATDVDRAALADATLTTPLDAAQLVAAIWRLIEQAAI